MADDKPTTDHELQDRGLRHGVFRLTEDERNQIRARISWGNRPDDVEAFIERLETDVLPAVATAVSDDTRLLRAAMLARNLTSLLGSLDPRERRYLDSYIAEAALTDTWPDIERLVPGVTQQQLAVHLEATLPRAGAGPTDLLAVALDCLVRGTEPAASLARARHSARADRYQQWLLAAEVAEAWMALLGRRPSPKDEDAQGERPPFACVLDILAAALGVTRPGERVREQAIKAIAG